MKTILITGASSGIGKATVDYFLTKNWNVIATARNIESLKQYEENDKVKILLLDVTKQESIETAVNTAINFFGKIDVLVNNAGFALAGVFEDATKEDVDRQFDVNVFGLMECIRAVLPHFRQNKSGTIINISSVAGHSGFPTFALYNATKFAVEGFSESLWYELSPFNIKVKLVEPGPIKTDFYGRSMEFTIKKGGAYETAIMPAINKMQEMGNKGLPSIRVAKTIYKAANSNSRKLRYPVGALASFTITLRHMLPNSIYRFVLQKFMGL